MARDVGKIKSYNKKVQGPSNVQRFGKGLAKAINQGRDQLAKQKTKTGGINFGGSSNNKSPFSSGSTSNPFDMKSKSEPKKKAKNRVIKIQQ